MKIIVINILFAFCFLIPAVAAIESRVIYNQGLEAFKSGNYSSAELLFRKTLENDDNYRDQAWFYLARTILQQGKYKAAIFELNSFLTKCRTESLRIESRFWMAESYYYLNDSLKAIEEYNRFLEKSEDTTLKLTSHDRIATIYFNQQRYEEAIIEWEKSIKISTDMDQNAQMVIKIGRALFKNGEYEKSLERLLPLLSARINSQNKAEIRLLVGRIYQLQSDNKKALLTLNAIPKELTDVYPFYDVYYFRALSYLSMERVSSAKSELELFYLIGKKSEFYYHGMFELGKIMLSGNKPESGIELLNKIWESSDNQELSVRSGILIAEFYMDNEPVKSINYLEKYITIEDDETHKKVLLILAKSYIKADMYSKAESVIQIYIEKYPYDQNIDEIKFLKGVVYLEKGDLDTALEIFNSIKEDNPFSKFINDTDYYMALVSYKKGKLDEASNYLRSYTMKKDVNKLFDARMLLAEIYITTGELKRAEKEINILVNNFTRNANVDRMLYSFAKRLHEKNDRSAQTYFGILQYKYPESSYSSMVNLLYGTNYYENKNYEKAIFYYEKYLNSNVEQERGHAYYNLLQANYNLKRYERIIEIIKSVKIPALDENQWREIPLIHSRSHYQLKNYEQVYNILKWENITGFSDDDIRMLIESTVKTGDISSAQKMITELKNKENLQKEMLLIVADYYETKQNYDETKNIYNTILVSGAEEPIKEKARISLAEIYSETGSYEQSLSLLNQVEMKDNVAPRDCLIIINHFYSGKEKKGAEITDSRLNFLLNTKFTEKVLLLNMLYHYNQKDVNSFNRYVKLLNSFKQNADYINYLSGKLYFETGSYKQSYLYFYKLSLTENEYTTETSYYLGRLNLLYNNNRNNSIKYYQKVLKEENKKNEYVQKSKIELALIYSERKDYNASKVLLSELINEIEKGRYRIEAENLVEILTAKEGKLQ